MQTDEAESESCTSNIGNVEKPAVVTFNHQKLCFW